MMIRTFGRGKNLKYDNTQIQYSGVLENVAELRIVRLLNTADL